MSIFKLICLILLSICAIACMIIPMIFSEKKYPNNAQRIRLIVKVRMGCFLGMMVLLLICLIF